MNHNITKKKINLFIYTGSLEWELKYWTRYIYKLTRKIAWNNKYYKSNITNFVISYDERLPIYHRQIFTKKSKFIPLSEFGITTGNENGFCYKNLCEDRELKRQILNYFDKNYIFSRVEVPRKELEYSLPIHQAWFQIKTDYNILKNFSIPPYITIFVSKKFHFTFDEWLLLKHRLEKEIGYPCFIVGDRKVLKELGLEFSPIYEKPNQKDDILFMATLAKFSLICVSADDSYLIPLFSNNPFICYGLKDNKQSIIDTFNPFQCHVYYFDKPLEYSLTIHELINCLKHEIGDKFFRERYQKIKNLTESLHVFHNNVQNLDEEDKTLLNSLGIF